MFEPQTAKLQTWAEALSFSELLEFASIRLLSRIHRNDFEFDAPHLKLTVGHLADRPTKLADNEPHYHKWNRAL